MRALALAVLFAGIGMIISGLTTLWLYGAFGASPLGGRTSLPSILDILLSVGPMVALGGAFLLCSIATLGGAGWGLTAMRVVMIAALVLVAGFATLRAVVGVFSSTGSINSMRTYQAMSAFNYILTQSVLPVLVLLILRIHRRTAQPRY
jgi:hypothetical protein